MYCSWQLVRWTSKTKHKFLIPIFFSESFRFLERQFSTTSMASGEQEAPEPLSTNEEKNPPNPPAHLSSLHNTCQLSLSPWEKAASPLPHQPQCFRMLLSACKGSSILPCSNQMRCLQKYSHIQVYGIWRLLRIWFQSEVRIFSYLRENADYDYCRKVFKWHLVKKNVALSTVSLWDFHPKQW